MEKMTPLLGHTSPETAYVVDDYPYGFTLRCKIRYWLEYKAGHGFRFCSQTTNPKRAGEHWNAPKKGTYIKIAAAMYLDENQHVKCFGLSEYSDLAESRAFFTKAEGFLGEEAKKSLQYWVKLKEAYEKRRDEAKAKEVV